MPHMATDPTNLGKKPVTREFNFLDIAMRAWGAEFNAPDHGAYEFSNGRKYDSTDRTRSGLYGVVVTDTIEVDDPDIARYTDMDRSVLESDTDAPIHAG